MSDRPIGRKTTTGTGSGGVKRGGSAGTGGPAGNGGRPSGGAPAGGRGSSGDNGRKEDPQDPQRYRSVRGTRRGGSGLIVLVVILAILFFTCRNGGSSVLPGLDILSENAGLYGSDSTGSDASDYVQNALSGYSYTESLTGSQTAASSAGWYGGSSNSGVLNTQVSPLAREKRTVIAGDGTDQVTVMVYMCGTDLESKSGMATRDLQEMLAADTDTDRLNLLIYTGGCAQWRNNQVSSSVNQIYQIRGGQLYLLESDMGTGAMVSPSTLSGFIRYAAQRCPASRYELIFWDHGGGSNAGYGYDEKNPNAGSMTLAGINQALQDGGVTFDMIGFDTCLMATVENALMTAQYADYLVASEETEPGVGWYYTDWLTALAQNPSLDTLTLGRTIADTFADTCAATCPGQPATLSVTDLAELQQTVPEKLAAFSQETSRLISESAYQTVSDARSATREFAVSSRIDQIDLIHMARNLNTDSGNELAETLLSAVKYNRASSSMANSYGLSVYFPYKNASSVDSVVKVYRQIGMDENYTRCIQQFASMGVSGQVVSGGSYSDFSQLYSLFGGTGGSGYGADAQYEVTQSAYGGGEELLLSLLGDFMSSDFSVISGLDRSNTQFLQEGLDVGAAAAYLSGHMLNPQSLIWQTGTGDTAYLALSEEDWALVSELELSVFYNDGEGWLDMGLDTVFSYDDDGNLLAPEDRTWLALNGQIASYYHISTTGTEADYTILGRIPVLLNGTYANLLVVFDSDHEQGYVAGAVYDYRNGETETVAKNVTELSEGDTIDLICDGYDDDGTWVDTFRIGTSIIIEEDQTELELTNEYLGDGEVLAMFRFVDAYGQEYWTEAVSE